MKISTFFLYFPLFKVSILFNCVLGSYSRMMAVNIALEKKTLLFYLLVTTLHFTSFFFFFLFSFLFFSFCFCHFFISLSRGLYICICLFLTDFTKHCLTVIVMHYFFTLIM